MNHIDEGTIHAWIDGALDATQSREIEVHVAQCSVCAAAVAEARGFVAGASRILLALDDVPAGVTPRRAPAPRRQWRAAPWVTGIAAALVLAVGVTTWQRNGGVSEMVRSTDSAVPMAPKAIQTPASEPSAPAAAAVAELRKKAEAPPQAAAEARDRKQMSAANVAPQRVESAMRARVSLDEGRGARPAESPKLAAGEAGDVRALGARQAVSDSTRERLERLERLAGLAGCYSMQKDAEQKAAPGLVSQLSERAAGVAKRAVAAPAPASARAVYIVPAPPAIVRLDTARKRAGYVVLAATSDSLIGFWSEIGSDSASVDLLIRGEFVVARMNRVTCPER